MNAHVSNKIFYFNSNPRRSQKCINVVYLDTKVENKFGIISIFMQKISAVIEKTKSKQASGSHVLSLFFHCIHGRNGTDFRDVKRVVDIRNCSRHRKRRKGTGNLYGWLRKFVWIRDKSREAYSSPSFLPM